MGLFSVLKELANKVQKKNEANPNVETAPGTIFESIQEAIEITKQEAECEDDDPMPEKRTQTVEELKERVFEVQRENQANPNIPTADSSIFDELNDILEKHKSQPESSYVEEYEDFDNAEYEEVIPRSTSPESTPSFEDDRVIAITNSMGGSLALRAEPDFGAAVNEIRIPDASRVYVVEYSKHSINLDGKDSRWVLIDHDGQRGWILEGYLNFN